MERPRPGLARFVLVVSDGEPVEVRGLERAFPGLPIEVRADGPSDVDEAAWRRDDVDLVSLDRAIEARARARGAWAVGAPGVDAAQVGLEVLTRAQRWLPIEGARAPSAAVRAMLAALGGVRWWTRSRVGATPFARALDAWRWSRRLDAAADDEVQVGALVGGWAGPSTAGVEAARRALSAHLDAPLARAVERLLDESEGSTPSAAAGQVRDARALTECALEVPKVAAEAGARAAHQALERALAAMGPPALALVPSIRLAPTLAAWLGRPPSRPEVEPLA